MKSLYKYPQAEYPYSRLVEENRRRGEGAPEFELLDTGVFNDNRYFDVTAEYAKASPDDILVRITVANRGPEAATIHLLPTLWYRNTWSWGCTHEGCEVKPRIERRRQRGRLRRARYARRIPDARRCHTIRRSPRRCLFTENETKAERLMDLPEPVAHTSKMPFTDYVSTASRRP